MSALSTRVCVRLCALACAASASTCAVRSAPRARHLGANVNGRQRSYEYSYVVKTCRKAETEAAAEADNAGDAQAERVGCIYSVYIYIYVCVSEGSTRQALKVHADAPFHCSSVCSRSSTVLSYGAGGGCAHSHITHAHINNFNNLRFVQQMRNEAILTLIQYEYTMRIREKRNFSEETKLSKQFAA